jgi:hypothetical protein
VIWKDVEEVEEDHVFLWVKNKKEVVLPRLSIFLVFPITP